MKILIDADGCPVVDMAVSIAQRNKTECLILCDASHEIERDGAETITFMTGPDQVDFELLRRVHANDIVITQDYGLAAMCLARRALVMDQDGREYTDNTIDSLLMSRDMARKIRRSGGRLKGKSKRTRDQDKMFETAFTSLLERSKLLPILQNPIIDC